MTTIVTTHQGDMLFATQVGDFTLTCDVSPPMGGKGRAPTPPDLFAVSLGACVAAFVTNYCQHNGVDTEGIRVETSFEKMDKPSRLTNLRIQVKLPHGECADREAAIRRVAEHCTVHESIAQFGGLEITILDKTQLAQAA